MSEHDVMHISLSKLRDHPRNSNVMRPELLNKLKAHIRATGRYPPLIVRPHPEQPGEWQLLDGHHRRHALAELGYAEAACVPWDVGDDEALVLLATLNRLQGADDPRKRSALLAELKRRLGDTPTALGRLLPDRSKDVAKLLSLQEGRPRPAEPRALERVPRAVHFFLVESDRQRLDAALERIGGPRERALMHMVEQTEKEDSDGI